MILPGGTNLVLCSIVEVLRWDLVESVETAFAGLLEPGERFTTSRNEPG